LEGLEKGFCCLKSINSYFPSLTDLLDEENESILNELLQIEPLFEYPKDVASSFEIYLHSLQALISRVLDKKILDFGRSIRSLSDKKRMDEFFTKILNAIPQITWTNGGEISPHILSITTLCWAEHTHGVGRFLGDIYSRWLIPGKQLKLVYVHSMAFRFSLFPEAGFFIHELFLKIDTKEDLNLVKEYLPVLANEVALNISAVHHARKVVSLKPLSIDQKRILIQENISSLLNRPQKESSYSIFDQMHHFLVKVTAEEKVTKIKEQIAPLLEFRPQLFDRDIFHELQNFVSLFKNEFISNRELVHLSRIISYSYIFRKLLSNKALSEPNQRHLSLKLLHTKIEIEDEPKKILGILICINMLRENEIIGEKHLFNAIWGILHSVVKISGTSITDKNSQTNIKTLYIEIYKKDGNFTIEELRNLKKRLPREIKTRIESVINPIFMPRNEEEIMRNILILGNQLKYSGDIPHVIITFHKQTEEKIFFSVILLRVLKPGDKKLETLFKKEKNKFSYSDFEIKNVGLVRKKYPKEANIFDMHLDKKSFLRKDFSVDLGLARRSVYNILFEMLGDIRDYNGGMISKQNEVLNELKKLLLQINIRNDFILENFFYSLTPNYMQSIAKPLILKKLFLLVLEAIEHEYTNQFYFLKTQIVEDHFLLTLGAINPTLKDFVEERIETIDIYPGNLTSSFVVIYDISCISFMLKYKDSDEHQKFLQCIIETIKIWKETVEKTLPLSFFPSEI
jgi:hypothetical protein